LLARAASSGLREKEPQVCTAHRLSHKGVWERRARAYWYERGREGHAGSVESGRVRGAREVRYPCAYIVRMQTSQICAWTVRTADGSHLG